MREQKKQNLTDPNVRKRFVTYKEAAELYSMAYLEQYRIPGDYEGMAKKFTPDLVELYR